MTFDPFIAALYGALDTSSGDREASVLLAELIDQRAADCHPVGREDIREATIEGLVYAVDVGDRFGRALFYGSRQEKAELRLLLSLCPLGGEVWDVGANFGLYATAAAVTAGPTGRVQAFEPNRKAFALLERNLLGNGVADRATAHPLALSVFDGVATFYEAEESAFSGLSDTGRSQVHAHEVGVRRLDTVWREAGSRPIDLLKIDVEGHEGDVFAGAGEALAASPDIVVQFELSGKNLDDERRAKLSAALADLETAGFRIWKTAAVPGGLIAVSSRDDDFFAQAEGNLLMVRGDSSREEALRAAAANQATILDGAGDGNLGALLARLARRFGEDRRQWRAHEDTHRQLVERFGEQRRQWEAFEDTHRRIVRDLGDTMDRLVGMVWHDGVTAARMAGSAPPSPPARPLGAGNDVAPVPMTVLTPSVVAGTFELHRTDGDGADGDGADGAGIIAPRGPDGTVDPVRLLAALANGCEGEYLLYASPDHPVDDETLERARIHWVGLTGAGARVGGVSLNPGAGPGAGVLLSLRALRASVPLFETESGGIPAGGDVGPAWLAGVLETAGFPLVAVPERDGVVEGRVPVAAPSILPRFRPAPPPITPESLSRPTGLDTVLRAVGDHPPLGVAHSAAVTARGGLPGMVILADARTTRTPLSDMPRGLGLVAAPVVDPLRRHARSLAAGLASCRASHVSLLGTNGFVAPEDVARAWAMWRRAAAEGRPVGAIAFADRAWNGTEPEEAEVFHGAPVLRNGLIATAALLHAGLPAPEEAFGGGFEIALSFRLRRAGFEVLDAGAEATFIRRGPPPSRREDRSFLEFSRGLPEVV